MVRSRVVVATKILLPWHPEPMIAEYAHYEHLLSIATLVSAMFGLGVMLTAGDFIRVFRAPQGILLILAVQVLLSPLLAILVARVFMVPPPVTVGLLVCMALPGGLVF